MIVDTRSAIKIRRKSITIYLLNDLEFQVGFQLLEKALTDIKNLDSSFIG
jgi:hypothetical protein